jgi:hypothetical protein
MDAVFRAEMLAEVLALTTGAVRAFEPKRFPATWRFEPGVKSPTPTKPGPEVAKMDAVFRVPTLAEVLAMITGAEREFEPKTLPWTWRFALGVESPTPTRPGPDVAKMDAVLRVPTLAEVVAKTFGAVMAFEAQKLPKTSRLYPDDVVPTPTDPAVPKIDVVFRVETFRFELKMAENPTRLLF